MPVIDLRREWELPGLVFQIPCAGQWNNNPVSAAHPALYHPLLAEKGWDAFLAEAAVRYAALQARVDKATGGRNRLKSVLPVMLRLPMGVGMTTRQQRCVINGGQRELGGDDPRWSLAGLSEAFTRHFSACTRVMVYVGPIGKEDLWTAVAHSLQRVRQALAPVNQVRSVLFCIDSLGVGPSFGAMQVMVNGGIGVSQFACEPAGIAEGFTELLYGCVLTTGNWRQVNNYGAAVRKRTGNVWLITQNGDEKGEGLAWLINELRADARLCVLVHNDGWDKGIIAGVLGA